MLGIRKTNDGRAGAVLDAAERVALRTLVERVGYRAACARLQVSRATIATAQLGGRLNRGTALLLKLGLEGLDSDAQP